jgi:Na+-exporting ATPase
MTACVLGSFVVVMFGFNDGDLGTGCNEAFSPLCEPVFRARGTCYTTMTYIFVLSTWEMIDFRRSFFVASGDGGVGEWAAHLWGNKFLFLAITIDVVITVPTLYIPMLDHDVFLHHGLEWEWGVVFVAVFVFIAAVEGWKWAKRAWIRRTVRGPVGPAFAPEA